MIRRSSYIFYRFRNDLILLILLLKWKSMETKNYVTNYARNNTLKNHLSWFTLGHTIVMRISKWNSALQLAY